MQVNTLTKINIPGPNRKLMQQAFTRLMVPSHCPPKRTIGLLLEGVRQTASYARCGVSTS